MFKRFLSLSLVLVCLFGLGFNTVAKADGNPGALADKLATDVSDIRDNPDHDAIGNLAAYGALRGLTDSDGKFHPDDPCTQRDFAMMIGNLFPGYELTESDWYNETNVSPEWLSLAMQSVAGKLVEHVPVWSGSDDETVSRGLVCTLVQDLIYCAGLWPYVGQDYSEAELLADQTECSMSDFLNALWQMQNEQSAANALLWAREQGLLEGGLSLVDPDATPCTRAYAVWCMWTLAGSQSADSYAHGKFADVAADSFFEEAVAWAVMERITNGISNDAFAPNSVTTRGQVSVFLCRAYGYAVDLDGLWD